jgi:hypothetical protein
LEVSTEFFVLKIFHLSWDKYEFFITESVFLIPFFSDHPNLLGLL